MWILGLDQRQSIRGSRENNQTALYSLGGKQPLELTPNFTRFPPLRDLPGGVSPEPPEFYKFPGDSIVQPGLRTYLSMSG